MGDINQYNFVQQHVSIVRAPILEVGSKNYGNTPDFRSLFPGQEYLGADREEGRGVDVVLDLTCDFRSVSSKLHDRRFNTVICFSVLEHCNHPFQMCANIATLLNPSGIVLISVPFSWRIHGYPADYWRFTPDGVRVLFPGFDFDAHPGHLSTSVVGDTGAINNFMMRAELDITKGLKRKLYGRLTACFIELFRKWGFMPQIFRHPYLFPPVLINMIGVKSG